MDKYLNCTSLFTLDIFAFFKKNGLLFSPSNEVSKTRWEEMEFTNSKNVGTKVLDTFRQLKLKNESEIFRSAQQARCLTSANVKDGFTVKLPKEWQSER